MAASIGSKIPSAVLHEATPANKVDPAAVFAVGTHVIFAVPGAFTPGCSKTHLPGYIADFDKTKAAGVDSINCVSVNDAFTMAAWGDAHAAGGKVRMLADPVAALFVTSAKLKDAS